LLGNDGDVRGTAASALRRGDVVEIQGMPASGKTHLVYHLLITCVLPASEGTLDLGGWDKCAVLFDVDWTFDITRLRTLLVGRLRRLLCKRSVNRQPTAGDQPAATNSLSSPASGLLAAPSDERISALAERCLGRVHVFRTQSSTQLAISVFNLPTHLAKHFPETELGLVVLDPVCGLDYWPDRYEAEQFRESSNTNGQLPEIAAVHPLQNILTSIERCRRSYSAVIIMTNWGLNSFPEGMPFYKQHLHPFPTLHPLNRVHTMADGVGLGEGTPLPTGTAGTASSVFRAIPVVNTQQETRLAYPPITHHITLHPQRIAQFPIELSLAEATSEELKHRSILVHREEVIGYVRSATAESAVQPGIFTFYIGEDEVVVPDEEQNFGFLR
jgi:DNA-repair protein XRCC2